MKNFITISILFVLCSCSSDNSTFNPVSNLKIDNLFIIDSNIPQDFYDDLTFTNETTGYAVSRTGKIIKTTNGGTNWTTLSSNVTFPLKKVQFINENIGFVIGGDDTGSFILKTTNAGQSWTVTNLNSELNTSPNSLFFKNENEGFVVGNHLFKKTVDGGITWNNVFESTDENFQDVKFNHDLSVGYVTLNNGNYYKTINGGQLWQPIDVDVSVNNYKDIFFVCNTVYFKSNYNLINLNHGQNVNLPNPINKLLFIDAKKSIGIGQHYETGFFPYGDILLTNNNWSTFQQKSYNPSSEVMNFTAIAKISNYKTMIIGTGQIETKIITIKY